MSSEDLFPSSHKWQGIEEVRGNLLSQTSGIMEAPRQLFSDSPDLGNEPDPTVMENISPSESEQRNHVSVDWAKYWI